MVADTLGTFLLILVNKYKYHTSKSQFRKYNIFTIGREEKNLNFFSLNLFNFQI